MGAALVLISGLPAAGKTTLAARLGRELRIPVVHRDRCRREVLSSFRELPGGSDLIPEATTRMTLLMVTTVLDADGSVILDGNFNTDQHATPVRDLVTSGAVPAFEISLWGAPAELRRRFVERADPPLTPDLEPYFEEVLARPHHPVLPPDSVLAELDTTDVGVAERSYPDLLERVAGALGAPVASDPGASRWSG